MGKGVCTEDEKRACEFEFGENIEWACSNCPKKKDESEINPYTLKLLKMRAIMSAGYPVKANDLTMEEWLDMAEINGFYAQQEAKAWQTKVK